MNYVHWIEIATTFMTCQYNVRVKNIKYEINYNVIISFSGKISAVCAVVDNVRRFGHDRCHLHTLHAVPRSGGYNLGVFGKFILEYKKKFKTHTEGLSFGSIFPFFGLAILIIHIYIYFTQNKI